MLSGLTKEKIFIKEIYFH